MYQIKRVNQSVHWFISDLTARVVAESGIPSDRYHLGKLILRSLKDAPDCILQIDGAVDQSETNGSVLKRSVQCAYALDAMGLRTGDVMILMGTCHLDLAIPFYAALYLGVTVAPVDITLTANELKNTFEIDQPKIIFCQSDKKDDIRKALKDARIEAIVVTFDKGNADFNFNEIMERYNRAHVEDFKPANFDPDETLAFLIPTSGTTGLPKSTATTHKNIACSTYFYWEKHRTFPTPTRSVLILSPLQWLSAVTFFIHTPLLRFTRIQSSQPLTPDHTYHLINTYKPTFTLSSPTFMTTLLKHAKDKCDFTSFELITLGGSAVAPELLAEVKTVSPKAEIQNGYGISETSIIVFHPDSCIPESVGQLVGIYECRLIDVETDEDIIEANKTGELWLRGPSVVKGYYKNPEVTKEAWTEDGWFKTGDIFYRDDNWNFFFADRIKQLLKYRNHQVSPVEVESVIRKHPAILDVAVCGIPDRECGDLIVACVVKRPGHHITAQDIKDLVKESLTDSKHLRGGVVFVDQLPMTASTKLHRKKLLEMVMKMPRE